MAAKRSARVVPISRRTKVRDRTGEVADRGQAAEAARDMEQAHLQCRLVGHHWGEWLVSKDRNSSGQFREVTLRCRNCRSTKVIQRGGRGQDLGLRPRTKYVAGYLTKGLGRITGEAKDALWAEAFDRSDGSARRRQAG